MLKKVGCVFFITVIMIIVGVTYFEVNYPKVSAVKFNTRKLPVDTRLKILQISDVHGRDFTDKTNLVDNIRLQEPDIIVITGDLIDRNTTDFNDTYFFVNELVKVNPNIYFVPGNHEWDNDSTEDFLQGLLKYNVVILNNRNITIDFMNTNINICGVDDFHTNHANLEAATTDINQDFYTVLLSHSPGIVTEKHLPVDLVLSGHTHGGQVRLPFLGGIVAPGQGLFPKLQKGVYNLDPGKYLYIDSGLGTSVLPIRFMNRSQMSLITIVGSDN